jgi:MFS family permease
MLQATTAACLFGPFAVLLTSVEARTGADRSMSSLGMLLVSMVSAILAPVAGNLAARFPLRPLAALGVVLGSAGYLSLAAWPDIRVYFAAYGLLVGGGMSLTGIVIPAVLVTRWYGANRGRALGILHMPLLALVSPIVVNYVLKHFGVEACYLLLAALMASNLLFLPLLQDRPPEETQAAAAGRAAEIERGSRRQITEIAKVSSFWALSLATAAIISAGSMVNTHMVPMVMQWGVTQSQAATLIAFGALSGAAGAFLLGWLADRLGGALALAICALDTAVLCALLLLKPGYPALIAIFSLLGLHVSGAVPAFTLALSRRFDAVQFGAAIGLGTFIFMAASPFMSPIAGALYVRFGSYSVALIILIGLLLLGVLLALAGRGDGERHPPTGS